jgi:hypothetical protein
MPKIIRRRLVRVAALARRTPRRISTAIEVLRAARAAVAVMLGRVVAAVRRIYHWLAGQQSECDEVPHATSLRSEAHAHGTSFR